MNIIKKCKQSFLELKSLQNVTILAMLLALSVILGFVTTIQIGNFIKIGVSSIVKMLACAMFGPIPGFIFGALADLIGYLLKPTGAYFPGFTLTSAISGFIYGIVLYKKQINFWRCLLATFLVNLLCNTVLNTYWLDLLYGKGFLAILPPRIIKNSITCPVNALLFYSILSALKFTSLKRFLVFRNRKQLQS